LIEGLLTLARSEHEITERTRLDLAELAAAAERGQQEAVECGITISRELQPAPVEGSSLLLERLVSNLVENAVRHSPPGVVATVRTGVLDDHSFIQVETPGPDLQQAEVDSIFEPFRRLEGRTSSPGVGLGHQDGAHGRLGLLLLLEVVP
jgi:signal transduction histidine kinase